MHDFFKRNSKKLFAVAMVFLMVAFILPSGASSLLGLGNPTYGTSKYGKIKRDQVMEAQTAVNWISSQIVMQGRVQTAQGIQAQYVPLGQRVLGETTLKRLQADPVAFYLLREEARRTAPPPSASEIETLFVQSSIGVVRDGTVQQIDIQPADEQTYIRQQVNDVLRIAMMFTVRQTQLKASRPRVQSLLAQAGQQISLAYVEFDGAITDATPQPSDEQLQEQFKAYADTLPGAVTVTNPFGFGYRLPDAVKVETIVIPREAVRAQVQATQSDYQWKVEAVKQFQKNPKRFATPPSTTGPATTAPSTQPTFESVEKQAIESVISAATDSKLQQISDAISQRLSVEYQTYVAAGKATTAPSALTSPTYFESIAQDIQKQFGILPATASMADKFYSVGDLMRDPNLLLLAGELVSRTIQPKDSPAAGMPAKLALFEPTLPEDMGDHRLIARVIATRPATMATDLTPIRATIVQDWRRTQAYRIAKNAAEQSLAAVRDSFIGDAPSALAAGARGKGVVQTQLFDRSANTVPLVGGAPQPLSLTQQRQFILEACEVLKQSNPKRPFLLDLPSAGRAYVAAVMTIEPRWSSSSELAQFEQQLGKDIVSQYSQGVYDADQQTPLPSVLASLFEPSQIFERAEFKDSHGQKPAAP